MSTTDDLSRDDKHAVEFARETAFNSFLDDCDEKRANELFTIMVVEAFAQHFFTGEPGDAEATARVAALANAELETCGAAYRLVRVP